MPTLQHRIQHRSHACLFRVIGIHLNDGSLVFFPSPDDIIEQSEHDNGGCHQNTEIHRHRLDRGSDGEEAEEENDDTEAHGENVDRDAKYAGKMEWAPDELARFAGVVEVTS